MIEYAITEANFYKKGANLTPIFFVLLITVLTIDHRKWTTKRQQTTIERIVMVVTGFFSSKGVDFTAALVDFLSVSVVDRGCAGSIIRSDGRRREE